MILQFLDFKFADPDYCLIQTTLPPVYFGLGRLYSAQEFTNNRTEYRYGNENQLRYCFEKINILWVRI
jgi:hypothetical protein